MDKALGQKEIWKHLEQAGTVMLTTEGEDGLRARPMSIVQDSYTGILYFFTNAVSEKVDEIEDERNVCITGTNTKDHVFFSLSGKASLIRDPVLIGRFWSPAVAAWFPEGKDDPGCALIKVDVSSVDLWEGEENPVLFWYEIVKANLTSRIPDVGDVKHRKELNAGVLI